MYYRRSLSRYMPLVQLAITDTSHQENLSITAATPTTTSTSTATLTINNRLQRKPPPRQP
ncbi:hypothetical protein E2C01_076888 [Portunus trituberculatus]|uniref:Uncharacterized protein n=1 Tax=Portunus trituberculatus TaxID=210409 RepID=A0A5B7IIW5_PORTR|nr:hypothetical protein [Portunus trituberculatus]